MLRCLIGIKVFSIDLVFSMWVQFMKKIKLFFHKLGRYFLYILAFVALFQLSVGYVQIVAMFRPVPFCFAGKHDCLKKNTFDIIFSTKSKYTASWSLFEWLQCSDQSLFRCKTYLLLEITKFTFL